MKYLFLLVGVGLYLFVGLSFLSVVDGVKKHLPENDMVKMKVGVGGQYVEIPGNNGDVVGPASSVNGNLTQFGDSTGKVLTDSGVVAANVLTATASFTDKALIRAKGTEGGLQDSGVILTDTDTFQGVLALAGKSTANLTIGPAQVGPTNDGNDLVLVAGNGGITSGDAGDIVSVGGIPVDGDGGGFVFTARPGVGINKDGGGFAIALGAASGSGTDGIATIDDRIIAVREYVSKASDLARDTTTTLADDDELVGLTLSANTSYHLTGHLVFISASATPDCKIAFTIPTGATMGIAIQSMDFASSHVATFLETSGTSSGSLFITANRFTVVMISGEIIVGSTAGVLDLQWAQNISNGTATTLKQFSLLRLEKR